jgi:hypothetical protein
MILSTPVALKWDMVIGFSLVHHLAGKHKTIAEIEVCLHE